MKFLLAVVILAGGAAAAIWFMPLESFPECVRDFASKLKGRTAAAERQTAEDEQACAEESDAEESGTEDAAGEEPAADVLSAVGEPSLPGPSAPLPRPPAARPANPPGRALPPGAAPAAPARRPAKQAPQATGRQDARPQNAATPRPQPEKPARPRNPHAAQYKEQAEKFKALTAERDRLKNEIRMGGGDQNRAYFRYRDIVQKEIPAQARRLNSAKAEYDRWNAAHPPEANKEGNK